jgi:hypothetical protein
MFCKCRCRVTQANRYLGGFCSSQRIFPPQIIQVLLEIPNRVEDFPHIDLPWAFSSLARLGGGEQRCHQGPVLVCQIGGIPLSGRIAFNIAAHSSAAGICANYLIRTFLSYYKLR